MPVRDRGASAPASIYLGPTQRELLSSCVAAGCRRGDPCILGCFLSQTVPENKIPTRV